jgi:hypothetical protein
MIDSIGVSDRRDRCLLDAIDVIEVKTRCITDSRLILQRGVGQETGRHCCQLVAIPTRGSFSPLDKNMLSRKVELQQRSYTEPLL